MATRARSTKAAAENVDAGKEDRPPRLRDAEVLATAAKIFARRGYATATVQDLADDLGILKGSIYYYIESKEDLLFRLLNSTHDDVDKLLEQVDAIEGLDPLERLCEYVRAQVTYNLRNLARISVYYNDLDQLTDERRKEIVRRRKAPEEFVDRLIRQGQKEGLIDKKRDARLLNYTVFAVIIWPYRWFKPRGPAKLDDVVESSVRFARGGLVAT